MALADESGYESVICVKPEVHVYKIPPRATNRGYRLSPFLLPMHTMISSFEAKLILYFLGELFAQAPVEQYPGCVVEAVTDSSRYFVVRIEDGSGRHAFIGLGFADRGDSFDFNVALQDHFKWVKQEGELAKEEASQSTAPKLDLGFKEGQTIKISIGNIKKKDPGAKSRPMGSGLLLPPPMAKGAVLVSLPGGQQSPPPPYSNTDFGGRVPAAQPTADLWGDFTAAGASSSQDTAKGWVQF
ncbi:unnamed protein product [Coregonus sp. 'balchen']|nr:unnamed protein product [Coregonus sp. 'balchen']